MDTFVECDYSVIETRCILQQFNAKYSGVANWHKIEKFLTESKMKTAKEHQRVLSLYSCTVTPAEPKQKCFLTRSVSIDELNAQYIKEWASPTGSFLSPHSHTFTFNDDPWGVHACIFFFWSDDGTGRNIYMPCTMVQWSSDACPGWSPSTVRKFKPDEVFGDPNPGLIWQEEFQSPGISPAVKYSVVMNLPGTSDWTRKGHWYLNMNNNSVFEVLGVFTMYNENWEILSHKGERNHCEYLCEDAFDSDKGIVRIQPKPKPEDLDDGFVLTGKLVNTLEESVPGKTWAKGPADATSAKHPPYSWWAWETTEVKKPKSRKGQVLTSVNEFPLTNRITGEPQWDPKHGTWRHPYDTWSEGKWVLADSGWSESFITEDRWEIIDWSSYEARLKKDPPESIKKMVKDVMEEALAVFEVETFTLNMDEYETKRLMAWRDEWLNCDGWSPTHPIIIDRVFCHEFDQGPAIRMMFSSNGVVPTVTVKWWDPCTFIYHRPLAQIQTLQDFKAGDVLTFEYVLFTGKCYRFEVKTSYNEPTIKHLNGWGLGTGKGDKVLVMCNPAKPFGQKMYAVAKARPEDMVLRQSNERHMSLYWSLKDNVWVHKWLGAWMTLEKFTSIFKCEHADLPGPCGLQEFTVATL